MTFELDTIAIRRAAPAWTLGDRLRKVRRDVLGMTQPELAAALSIDTRRLAAWETDRHRPKDPTALARQMEQLSGVDYGWFLIDSDAQPTRTTVILFDEGTQK
jgi:transcriptional regulator with XRE-family HTH domain